MLNNKKFIIQLSVLAWMILLSSHTFAQLNFAKKTYIFNNFGSDGNESERDGGYDMVFGTNSLERMRILKNGNVGIGTHSPVYKLQVAGDIYANGGWMRVSGNNGLHFESYGGGLYMTDNTWIRTYGSKNFYHNTGIMRTDGELQVGANGSRFIVNTAGNVGIGTSTPVAPLHVEGYIYTTHGIVSEEYAVFYDSLSVGSAASTAKFNVHGPSHFNGNVGIGTTSPNAPLQFSNAVLHRKIVLYDVLNNDFQFYGFGAIGTTLRYNVDGTGSDHAFFAGSSSTSANELMRIKGNGNVGIGTTSPHQKLHVNGNIQLSDATIPVGLTTEVGGTTPILNMDANFKFSNANTTYRGGLFRIDTRDNTALFQWRARSAGSTTVSPLMALQENGNLGIGTETPTQKLQVEGSSYFNGTTGIGTAPVAGIQLKVKGSFDVSNSSDSTVLHVSSGKELIFIGTNAYNQYLATQSDPNSDIQENGYSLWVSKGVVSEDYAIADVAEWDDYVFDKEYALPSLQKVAAFIAAHKHLPNIPSEAEVKKNGYSLHTLNRGFLKTMEEMTLYAIEQAQTLEKQQTQIEAQQKEIEVLKAQVAAILEQLNKK